MAATMTTVVKGSEESGNFFTRLAWYYQMGVLLLLSGMLIFATDYLLYSETRSDTAKVQDKVEQLKAKNAQGSIIRQNLAATVVKGSEESGNFFTRLAWYYQMGVLLLLSGMLIFATDYLLYREPRSATAKVQDKVEQLKAKNAQGSIIRQNLAATEQTLKEKREEIDRLRDLLPDQVEISR